MLADPLFISTWFLKHGVSLDFFFQFQTRKKSILKQTRFFVEFELDFYCLCSLQKSISKSNWFFNFLNLIFRNWKKIEWHSIFQKSSGDRQGVSASNWNSQNLINFHHFMLTLNLGSFNNYDRILLFCVAHVVKQICLPLHPPKQQFYNAGHLRRPKPWQTY